MRKLNNVSLFTEKYKNKNPIGRYLISNFFRNVENMLPKNVESLLEVGCGPGYSTEKIAEKYSLAQYCASDIDADLIELARQRNPGVQFSKESVYNINHRDGSFDLVICLEVLEHLTEPEKAVKEIMRVTNKYALLSVPNEPMWRLLNLARFKYLKELGNTPGHINHWSSNSFIKFLRSEMDVLLVRSPLPWTIILATKK